RHAPPAGPRLPTLCGGQSRLLPRPGHGPGGSGPGSAFSEAAFGDSCSVPTRAASRGNDSRAFSRRNERTVPSGTAYACRSPPPQWTATSSPASLNTPLPESPELVSVVETNVGST